MQVFYIKKTNFFTGNSQEHKTLLMILKDHEK